MATTDNLSLLEKRTQNRFIISISFLVFCVFLASGLFIYQRAVQADIGRIESNLQWVKNSISQRESDPLVQSYVLYQRNTSVFERLWYESNIPLFVSHIKTTALRYGVEITWFNYNEWNLSMSVRSDNDQRGFGYEKVVSFLRDYRSDSEALFHLDNVSTFSWHDRIEYNISLRLKNQSEVGSEDELDNTDNWDSDDQDVEEAEIQE